MVLVYYKCLVGGEDLHFQSSLSLSPPVFTDCSEGVYISIMLA